MFAAFFILFCREHKTFFKNAETREYLPANTFRLFRQQILFTEFNYCFNVESAIHFPLYASYMFCGNLIRYDKHETELALGQ